MIIDTDVIIWYMRGNNNAQKVINSFDSFAISVVTYMELVQGMRSKNELNELRKALRTWNTTILYINEEISAKAMFYVEQLYLSHTLKLADALIAATALVYSSPIITGNSKHYKAITNIEIHNFLP